MNIVKPLTEFRVGTLNVHFFTDLYEKANVYHLAELLKPMSFDFLALQEVLHNDGPPGVAPESKCHFKLLSDLLELPHTAFCSTSNNFGNGILSRFPLKTIANYHTNATENHHVRGMLEVKLDNEFFQDNNAAFYVTHLDQINEQIRLNQLEEFQKSINDSHDLLMMMGDFNSLTFDDYSDDYFQKHICHVREQNSWEKPYNLVTNKMKEYGYKDCWREMNQDVKDEQTVTCIYKTRIDYLWKRGELKNGWKINQCKIFSMDCATDHNGVLIDFIKDNPTN